MVRKKDCWMCKKSEYRILDKEVRIKRILDEDKDCYIIVPRDPLIFGHVLIVLKKHRNTLKDAILDELNLLNKQVLKWSKILTEAFDDCKNVYLTCLNDEHHLHYHLFPVRDKEKPGCGCGHKWLGDHEGRISKKLFENCCKAEKESRGAYIRKTVKFLKKQKRLFEGDERHRRRSL